MDYEEIMRIRKILGHVVVPVGAVGVITSVIQLVLVYRDKDRRDSVFRLSLISLNVADLLSSVSFVLRGNDLIFSQGIERLIFASILFSLTSSFCHVLFLAIQRLIAVVFPFKVKRILTRSRCYIFLSVMWVVSVASSFLFYFASGKLRGFCCLVMIVGILLMITYSVICYRKKKSNITSNNISQDMRRRRQQSDRRVFIYSLAITTVFVICNFPVALEVLILPPSYIYFSTAEVLLSLNPFLDTLLYFVWSYAKWKSRVSLNTIAST